MTTKDPLLVALDLEEKPCLVIGSGAEAAVRASALLRAGAEVRVVAEAPGPELEALAASVGLKLERRTFLESDLEPVWLVILADRDAELAARVGALARARRLLFCAIDRPAHNNFAHLAVARAGRLSVAISSGGSVPALAKRLRQELERVAAEAGLAEFVEWLARLREELPRAERAEKLARIVAGVRLGPLELPPRSRD